MHSVVVIGGVSLDRVVQLERLPEGRPETIFSSATRDVMGSTGAGKALNLARLGFEVFLHAQLGQDQPGTTIRDYFLKQPLETLFFPDPQGTETHINLMDSGGQRVSIYTSYSSFEPEIDLEPLMSRVRSCDFLVLNIMNYARRLIPFAKQHGKKIWCDVHDYDGRNPYHSDFLAAADYLFVSADKLPDPDAFLSDQIALGKELVVCTFGKRGAKALAKSGETCEIGIVDSYPAIDTNGAGDAFFSGFLYGFAHSWSLAACMKLGSVIGGLCVASSELYHPDLTEEFALSEFEIRNLTSTPAN